MGSQTGSAGSSHDNAGEESQAVAEAAEWFISQRLAPNGAVDPNAYAAAAAQAAALPTVGGAWTERTNLPGRRRHRLLRLAAVHRPDERFQQLRRR